MSELTLTRTVILKIEQGLHIRACSKVVALSNGFGGKIKVRCGDKVADGASMFDLVQLAAHPGSQLILEGTGDGAENVLDALEHLLSRTSEAEY